MPGLFCGRPSHITSPIRSGFVPAVDRAFLLTSLACLRNGCAMKHIDKRFGSRLSAVMARRQVSHRALADYCGVSPRSISNWVAGHKPPLPILRLIGIWWDFATVDYLTGASDVMPEPGMFVESEASHKWVEIDDGQTMKLCVCGLRQCDDGSFQDCNGDYFITAPRCGMSNLLPNPEPVRTEEG